MKLRRKKKRKLGKSRKGVRRGDERAGKRKNMRKWGKGIRNREKWRIWK